jgi:Raf kinase inhibitor-like YbhB/YbcL family protein
VAQTAVRIIQVIAMRTPRSIEASRYGWVLLTALALAPLALGAQQRGAQPPAGGQPAQPGQRGGGGGGGGRGRGPIQVMTLSTTGWTDGGMIPARYTQAGGEMSPPLSWSGAPDGVVSYVLIVHDTDAAIGNGTDDILHWMLWNIPATATSIRERAPALAQLPDGTRQISATGPYYRGPGALSMGPPHHYVFELFALDSSIEVPAIGASPPATRMAVLAAMAGHIRAKAVLTGLFKRN